MTGCLLDYTYFKENYKLIATDLNKQEALDAVPKVIQQISFTGNLDRAEDAWMVFIFEEVREPMLDFSRGTVRVL